MGCVEDGEEPHQMKDTIYGYAIEGHQIVRIVEALYVKSSIKLVRCLDAWKCLKLRNGVDRPCYGGHRRERLHSPMCFPA